jgi:hypothetical protein
MAIYFLGDPDLQYLSRLGELKVYIAAAALSLVSMPWIAEQLNGCRALRDGPDTVYPRGDLRVAFFIPIPEEPPLILR